MSAGKPLIVITGPTASGKGAVAFEVARRLGGEIVSLDSMKVYREMEIGTAQPSLERRRQVAYHLIDLVPPDRHFSAGEYLPLLEETLRDIAGRGREAIVCGGTALYLKLFLDGLTSGPGADWRIRARLLAEAEAAGAGALRRRLEAVDPQAAAKIHPDDLRRTVRALEFFEIAGKPLSEGWTWGAGGRREEVRLFGLGWERRALYERVDRRVLQMVEQGLFEEAERLRERRPPASRSALQSIGYKEIIAGLEGGLSRAQIVEHIQRNTRRLVKRQLTWFRKLPVEWLPAGEPASPQAIAGEIICRRDLSPPPAA
jgi:tRNA dimethylallyltransferase